MSVTPKDSTLTLTDFLLARIAEDEAGVQAWDSDSDAKVATMWTGVDPAYTTVATGRPGGAWFADGREVKAPRYVRVLYDPARVLAECEAKRRIVDAHPLYRGPRLLAVDSSSNDLACETCHATSRVDDESVIEALGPCDTLLALASVYADHPDYRDEWRP